MRPRSFSRSPSLVTQARLTPIPLTVYLHSVGHNYFDSEEGVDNSRSVDATHYGGFSIGFNDLPRIIVKNAAGSIVNLGAFLETDSYGYTYYTGWNSNYVPSKLSNGFRKSFRIAKPFEEGVNVLYTEKAMLYAIQWMRERSPWASKIDPDRLYATGSSMGGGGSLMLAVHHPQLFSAVNAFIGRTCAYDDALYSRNAYVHFGTVEMNVPTPTGESAYDLLNIGQWVATHKGLDYPPIRTYNGRQDETILWPQMPDFYPLANQARLGLQAYWDNRTHATARSARQFPRIRQLTRIRGAHDRSVLEYLPVPHRPELSGFLRLQPER